jgi:hypothetical protein
MRILYMGIEILWRKHTDVLMMVVGGLCRFLVEDLINT